MSSSTLFAHLLLQARLRSSRDIPLAFHALFNTLGHVLLRLLHLDELVARLAEVDLESR